MGFLSNMMTPPAPGSRGAQFGAAMGDMAPLLFSMAQGLRSGKGAAAYAPQGLAAMMYQQQLEEEQKMSEEERAYRRQQDARTWGWRESERAREDQLRNAAQAGLAQLLGGGGGASQYDAMAATGGPTNAAAAMTNTDFVAQMWPHALRVSQATGLDPRLVVAQAAQETGWGKHAPNNNYFGIKSHGRPGGATLATKEVYGGRPVAENASFRTYGGMGQSADDYAAFLQQNPRYGEMLGAEGLDAQVAALGRSGYATDPNYAASVGRIARAIQPPTGAKPRLSPERAAAIMSNPYASEAARSLVMAQFMPKAEEKPQIVKGADGYNYWVTSDGRSTRAVPGAKAPDTGWRTLTPDQAEALGYDPAKGPYQIGLSGENRGKVTTGSGTTINVGDQNPLSPGQKKVDEEFAPKYLEWITTGGADSNVNTAQIASVLGKLESGEQLTGPEVGYVPELFRALTNPDAEQARAQVEQVVQRNLREILGGQFAQMEGAQLIKRAYDQKLPPEYNAARLRALYGVLDHAAKAKASMIDYWNANNGTLAGYQGPRIPSVEDFYAAIEGATAQQGSAAMPTVTGMAARIDKFVESALDDEERRIFEELPAADQMTFLRRKGFK